jgi:hypothetical protein
LQQALLDPEQQAEAGLDCVQQQLQRQSEKQQAARDVSSRFMEFGGLPGGTGGPRRGGPCTTFAKTQSRGGGFDSSAAPSYGDVP